ncbi:MFS transporter [Altericroceibacterium endophyticum]|uniref:MFS transporter n=1 Tax=Altericroceibacterium endophyticum TaxID=1808508 RepID=A0A6I4T2H7_9SPHN|nr:MFS transporter [Altericroceibacterium endophyticum]MXO64190.1 MFS transporter [Altericroceibacterium endophyticum]
MSPSLRIGTIGFCLIALCYGFARFAFGLFLPQIDAELNLGPSLSGMISGGSFAGYCIAIIAAAALTERFGARTVAFAAATLAAIGMAGIALAPSPAILAFAVIVAGSSTGLASPPMAAAVAAAVRADRQNATNTIINAGTSAGVALSGPIALAVNGQWRVTFAVFAGMAVILAIGAARALPSSRGSHSSVGLPPITRPLGFLIIATFLTGMASTAIWSFGGQLVSQILGWGPTGTAILWSCIGAGGILGAWAGSLVSCFGLQRIHLLFCGVVAATILAVGSGVAIAGLVLAGGALFGAAYVMLTGVYLIWGVRALPDRPATGLTIGFLTLAIGQTVGAPIFGLLMSGPGMGTAILTFAVLALLAGVVRTGFGHDRA